jgi:probable phosphoglycerate mutase
MTRIILIRHGHVEGIDPPRFRGRMDLALTPTGEAQAVLTGATIAARWNPAAIWASPLGRSRQTASAIAAACGGLEVGVLEGLNDLDYGAWQGKTHEEARAASPALFDRWREAPEWVRFPGGESLQDLAARAADALRLVVERHGEASVVLVGHDSVNRVVLLHCLGLPLGAYRRLAQDPCAISELEIEDGEVRVRRINETAHLAAGIE